MLVYHICFLLNADESDIGGGGGGMSGSGIKWLQECPSGGPRWMACKHAWMLLKKLLGGSLTEGNLCKTGGTTHDASNCNRTCYMKLKGMLKIQAKREAMASNSIVLSGYALHLDALRGDNS